jgi:Ssp1 endopeptidase immunity protein Rap1a
MRYHKPVIPTLITVALALLPVSAANAQSSDQIFTAKDLRAACQDTTSKICSAYIIGYEQGFYYSSVSSQAGYTPCVKSGLTEPVARLITTKFMDEHPETLGQGAASVVAQALVSAFPCAGAH